MKKFNLKSGAIAVVTAGLMLSAMPSVALAESDLSQYNDPTITKNWEYGKTDLDQLNTFTFNLHFDKVEAVGTNPTVDPDKIDATTTITTTATDTTGLATGSKNLSDLVGQFDLTSLKAPGQYYFTLSEVDPENPNVTYDTDTFQVRVDVVWNEVGKTTEIDGMYVFDGADKAEDVTFNNESTAVQDDLTISKTVSGTAANTEDVFNYTLTLLGGTEGTYEVTLADGTTATVSESAPLDFTLKDGESITVNGLPDSAGFQVTEKNTDYKEFASANGGAEIQSAEGKDLTIQGEVSKDAENTVAFRNEKGFPTPTGINMNTLPFVGVGVVAVAGGAALVISRTRRSHEDF